MKRERCTGVAASWCPNHGTCTCEYDEHTGAHFDGPDCPLHSEASDHPLVDARTIGTT